jgi:hypothetical protein
MGAHRTMDRTLDVTRVVGHGVTATSVALALAGTGAGLATASSHDDGYGYEYGYEDGHGGEHGHGEHGDGEDTGADCGPGDGLVGGLIGDLGLSGSSGQPCAEDASGHGTDDGASTPTASSSTPTASSRTDGGAGTHRAAVPTSTNPDDIPPAPGETKVIDIPDDPTI